MFNSKCLKYQVGPTGPQGAKGNTGPTGSTSYTANSAKYLEFTAGNEMRFLSKPTNSAVCIGWGFGDGTKSPSISSYGFYNGNGALAKIIASTVDAEVAWSSIQNAPDITTLSDLYKRSGIWDNCQLHGNLNIYNHEITLNHNDSTNANYNSISGNASAMSLKSTSYINLCANTQIQCRNAADTSWAALKAASVTSANNSSKRFKENITPITEERAKKILNIEVVTFDYKKGCEVYQEDYQNHDVTGVIAEDTIDIIKEVVNLDNDKPSGINYEKFVPYLIKMIQIHQKEIAELKATINN